MYHQKATNVYTAYTFYTPVLQHSDICQPSYVTTSKCPRAVIEVVGNLLVGKMAFNALAGPAITLVVYSPALRWLADHVHARLKAKLLYWSLDKEVASVVMLLDIVLEIGRAHV